MNPVNVVSAIRGPIMLITLGTLFAIDHLGSLSFTRTWPLLIIVFGVMKLLERVGPQPTPYQGGTQSGSYSGGGQQ